MLKIDDLKARIVFDKLSPVRPGKRYASFTATDVDGVKRIELKFGYSYESDTQTSGIGSPMFVEVFFNRDYAVDEVFVVREKDGKYAEYSLAGCKKLASDRPYTQKKPPKECRKGIDLPLYGKKFFRSEGEAEIIGAYTREKFAEEYLDGCRTFFCADTKLGIFSVFFLFDKTNQTDNGGGTDENGTARGGADRSFEATVAFLYKYEDGKSGASDAVAVTEAQAVVGEGDDRPDGESEQPVDKFDQKE